MFSSSLDHLVSTRRRAYGWTWDLRRLRRTGRRRTTARLRPGHRRALTDDPRASPRWPSVCTRRRRGRRPSRHRAGGSRQLRGHRCNPRSSRAARRATAGEVALGADTLAAIHQRHRRPVRDRRASGVRDRYRIVGQAVLRRLSDPEPLADGAVFTAAGARSPRRGDGGWNFVVQLAPGVDRDAAIRAPARRRAVLGGPITPTLPAEIDRVRQIDGAAGRAGGVRRGGRARRRRVRAGHRRCGAAAASSRC